MLQGNVNVNIIFSVSNITYMYLYNSVWSLATDEEIKSMQDKWREMINDGRAQEFFRKMEEARQKIGETTTILAYKGFLK